MAKRIAITFDLSCYFYDSVPPLPLSCPPVTLVPTVQDLHWRPVLTLTGVISIDFIERKRERNRLPNGKSVPFNILNV